MKILKKSILPTQLMLAVVVPLTLFGSESIYSEVSPDPYHVWTRIGDYTDSLRAVEAAELSPDGRLAVSASKFGYNLMCWRVADGTLLWEKKLESEIECITFSPDGSLIASGDEHYFMRIWDAETGKLIKEREHDSGLDGIAWSPDGKWVASGSEAGELWLWDTRKFSLAKKVKLGSTINSVDFTSDSTHAAVGGNIQTLQPDGHNHYTGFAKIVEITSGKTVKDFGSFAASVKSIRYSNDESLVATGSFDNTLRVFEVESGDKKFEKKLTQKLEAVAFQPTSNFLVVGGHERQLRFFRVGDYEEVLKLPCPRVEYIHFTRDGRLMLTAHEDSGAIILHLFHSNLQHNKDLYQKLSNKILKNRDLK